MKTARLTMVLVILLALAGCTARQRDAAFANVATSLFGTLLDAQSAAPLTQSTFRPSRATVAPVPAVTPEATTDDVPDPEVAADQVEITPLEITLPQRICPLAPLPLDSSRFAQLAENALGVVDPKLPAIRCRAQRVRHRIVVVRLDAMSL